MTYRKHLKAFATLVCVACSYAASMAQIPEGYYSSLKGKSGRELKNAVHEIIKDANVLSYGSGKNSTWDGFWQTDRTSDGRFIDRYSPESAWVKSTTQGAVGAGMNIEHSFPKSWWGGSKNQAYKDLYNLMPCESGINSTKGNFAMGKVTSGDKGNGATKVGNSDWGVKVWEPADEWKGDFARGYMYMVTCYQNFSWTSTGLDILETGDYPTLKERAYKLYIQWAKADMPTELEITRNNAVSKIQGNRNPFVDFPNLMEYIWGDSIDYAFDPATTVCTENYKGGDNPGGDTPTEESIKEYTFTESDCGFSIETTTCPTGKTIWKQSAQYGWVGSSYFGSMQNGDASIVSPEIDLTDYSSASFNFEHAANKMSGMSPEEMFTVEIRCDGKTTTIAKELIKWPKGTVWTFNNSGDISLDEYAGKKIQIVFHYTGNTEAAGTWEIKNMHVNGTKKTSGISETTMNDAAFNTNQPFEMFTSDGKRISNTGSYNGIIIIRQNGKTLKIKK